MKIEIVHVQPDQFGCYEAQYRVVDSKYLDDSLITIYALTAIDVVDRVKTDAYVRETRAKAIAKAVGKHYIWSTEQYLAAISGTFALIFFILWLIN